MPAGPCHTWQVLDEGEAVISGGKVGTWTYWAPEQVDKGVAYDQSVDMWSLGVVLYIMLCVRRRGPSPPPRASAPPYVLLPVKPPRPPLPPPPRQVVRRVL